MIPAVRRLPAGVGALAPALAVAAVLGYAVFVGAGRLLSPADFAVFAAYWGLLFGIGGMLAGVEQETVRLISVRGHRADRPVLLRLLAGSLSIAGLVVTAALLAAAVVVQRVLHGSWELFGLAMLAVVGFAVQYVVRGAWLGSGRVGVYAALVVAEAALRALALLILVAVTSPGLVACAAAVTVGSFAWLGAVRRPSSPPLGPAVDEPDLSHVLRKLGGLVLAAGFTSAVVTGYPALASAVAPSGSRAELGVLLAALTITRLPLLLLGPVQALLVPEVVGRLREDGWPAARAFVSRVGTAVMIAGVALAALALPLGARAVALLYGAAYRTHGSVLAGMTLGATLVALLLVLAAALVALDAHGWVVGAWATCFAFVVGVLAVPWAGLVPRVVGSLIAGPAVGVLVALVGARVVGRSRASDGAARVDIPLLRPEGGGLA